MVYGEAAESMLTGVNMPCRGLRPRRADARPRLP